MTRDLYARAYDEVKSVGATHSTTRTADQSNYANWWYDSYVAGWDSKFHWDFWRPCTAIRAGDTDGNRRTVKDATWQSYLETPPVQDYPSTHSALGAGAAEILKRCFRNDHVPFSMGSLTAQPANPAARSRPSPRRPTRTPIRA